MKKIFVLVVLHLLLFVGLGSARAGTWSSSGITSDVSIPGSGGLDVATHKCAKFVGTLDWQSCVAHHDGLYSLGVDGSINRNYVRPADSPKPNPSGELICKASGFVNKSGQIVWEIPDNPLCRAVK